MLLQKSWDVSGHTSKKILYIRGFEYGANHLLSVRGLFVNSPNGRCPADKPGARQHPGKVLEYGRTG